MRSAAEQTVHGNHDFQRRLAEDLLDGCRPEEAIEFCIQMGWQGTLAVIQGEKGGAARPE